MHLYSGYRSVTVTDGRGCQVIDSVFVPESSEIISILTIDSTVNCYGSNNGIVSVTTSGGHPNYIYSWSNGQLTITPRINIIWMTSRSSHRNYTIITTITINSRVYS